MLQATGSLVLPSPSLPLPPAFVYPLTNLFIYLFLSLSQRPPPGAGSLLSRSPGPAALPPRAPLSAHRNPQEPTAEAPLDRPLPPRALSAPHRGCPRGRGHFELGTWPSDPGTPTTTRSVCGDPTTHPVASGRPEPLKAGRIPPPGKIVSHPFASESESPSARRKKSGGSLRCPTAVRRDGHKYKFWCLSKAMVLIEQHLGSYFYKLSSNLHNSKSKRLCVCEPSHPKLFSTILLLIYGEQKRHCSLYLFSHSSKH